VNISKFRLSTAGPIVVTVVLLIAFGVLGAFSSQIGETNINTTIRETIRPITKTAANILFNSLYTLNVVEINRILDQYVDGSTVIYGAIYNVNGARLSERGGGWVSEPDAVQRRAQTAISLNQQVTEDAGRYMIICTPISAGNEVIGVVEFVIDQSAARSAIGIAQINILALTLGILAATAVLSFYLIRAATAPINRLASAAQTIGDGDFTKPIDVTGPAEIASLAHSLEAMRTQLQQSYQQLETQIFERTESLNLRTTQLEASGYVSRRAAELSDLRSLLDETVRLISEQFNFYHAGIFLVDPEKQFVVLQSASSNGGQAMLKRGHRLAIGRQGIVGNVAYTKLPRLALDVGAESVYFDNPDLPDTRSEMALPLIVRGEVIGVLDIQSVQPNAFSKSDLNTLQTMADQIALSIENARLLSESQASLKQLAETNANSAYDVWQKEAAEHANLYTYNPLGTAVRKTDSSRLAQTSEGDVLLVPLALRGQKIGSIRLIRKDPDQTWSDDEKEIAETLSNQLSLAMENIRLLEESQRRAAREQIIGELTSAFTRSSDIEVLLQNAATEMSRILNASKTRIELSSEEAD
jgi:GAF domain-containing protein/HAMP domain-containing protein